MNPTPNPNPIVTNLETIERREGYQSLEPVRRPSYWGVDLADERRPGVMGLRAEPQPLPNARLHPSRQPGVPASPMHGRTNKQMPPVFGTTLPLQGVSGAIKRYAYSMPDHYPMHWLLMLLGDRVESFGYHAKKYAPLVVPLFAGVLVARALRA